MKENEQLRFDELMWQAYLDSIYDHLNTPDNPIKDIFYNYNRITVVFADGTCFVLISDYI